jgi:hypothetical protein
MITFGELELNTKFFDTESGEYFSKICGNAAEFISGGDYFTGQLVTFDSNELVEKINQEV